METAQHTTEISSVEDIARLASDYREAAEVHNGAQKDQERRGDWVAARRSDNSTSICANFAWSLELLAGQVERGETTIAEAASWVAENEG